MGEVEKAHIGEGNREKVRSLHKGRCQKGEGEKTSIKGEDRWEKVKR